MNSKLTPDMLFYIIILIDVIYVSESFILSTDNTDRHIETRIFVSNGGKWGDWNTPEFCPNGTYAKGFGLKVEQDQGDDDDTALNGIRLDCYPRANKRVTPTSGGFRFTTTTYYYYTTVVYSVASVTSDEGPWGYYGYESTCDLSSDQFLTSFNLRVEKSLTFGDDTAANDIHFMCRDIDGSSAHEINSHNGGRWGTWGTYSTSCPDNTAICGLSTKVESAQNIGAIDRDDTALNDVIFYCCT